MGRRRSGRSQWLSAVADAAGRLFCEAADEILVKLHDVRAVIRDERRMPGVGLQIAAGHTIALTFLPDWLTALPAAVPGVRTRVMPTNVHDSILMLVNGNCDLMFAYHHPAVAAASGSRQVRAPGRRRRRAAACLQTQRRGNAPMFRLCRGAAAGRCR